MQWRGNRAWWVLLVVALGLRIAIVVVQGGQLSIDRDAYLEIARHIVAGEGFSLGEPPHPTAYRPPLYPLVIAALFACGGTAYALGAVQVILGTATVLLAGRVACRFGGNSARLAAGALVAVDPLLLQYTAQPMTETLAAFLATGWLAVLAVRSDETPLLRWQIVSGVLLGLGVLCRPIFLVVAGLFALLELVARGPGITSSRRFQRIGILFVAVGVTLLPWIARNALVMGKPIATTTHGGYTLFLANNPVMYDEVICGAWGTTWDDASLRSWQAKLDRETEGMSEIERDRWMSAQARETIRSQPRMFLYACGWRILRLWDVLPRGPQISSATRFVMPVVAVFYIAIYVAFLVGCLTSIGDNPSLWRPVLALLLGFTLLHTLYWTDARMRAPLMPAVAVVAAQGLIATFGRRRAT
ncbi:MAG TPA: glycosyltransferase family 39 protein [Planctomycetaceae bacterium]|nr:glycosyltransferase family 39 protein [Planctomycetaceae bacterium]